MARWILLGWGSSSIIYLPYILPGTHRGHICMIRYGSNECRKIRHVDEDETPGYGVLTFVNKYM